MGAQVMCRVCKQRFDRTKTEEGTYWVMPSRNWYYHVTCYNNWKAANTGIDAQLEDEKWEEYIWEFLSHDIKVPYNYLKCRSQLRSFSKKGKTYKGMFFTLKYFYEIRHGNWDRAEGGIGIIPYVYEEATQYWQEQYERNDKIIAGIEKQMEEKINRGTVTVQIDKKESQKKIKTFDLNEIEVSDDD